MKKIPETVKEFVYRCAAESRVDVDIELLKKSGRKFSNNHVLDENVLLFNPESFRAAFDFVFRKK